jgi:hypothetical protein
MPKFKSGLMEYIDSKQTTRTTQSLKVMSRSNGQCQSNFSFLINIMRTSLSRFLPTTPVLALALTLITSATTMIGTQAAKAQVYCQCVGYVQRVIGRHIPVWSAKDAVSALPRMGYRQVGGAQNGTIAVFQPFHGGVDRTHGHVGIVVGGGNGFVTIRSANQWSNRQFLQAGCSNVSDVNFRINNGVTFWAR